MEIRPYEQEFIDYVRDKKSVSLQEIKNRFGDEADFLVKSHKDGGYITIDKDFVNYIGDCYRIG